MNNVIRKAQEELELRTVALETALQELEVARRQYEMSAQRLTGLLIQAGGVVIAIAELAEPVAEAVA